MQFGLREAVDRHVSRQIVLENQAEQIGAGAREAGFVEPRLLEVPAVSPLVLAKKPT